MRIKVTQECIDKGTRKDTRGCPIALAVHDTGYPEAVIGGTIYYLNGGDYKERSLPAEAQWFVTNFDLGWPVVPFEFDLEVPGEKQVEVEQVLEPELELQFA